MGENALTHPLHTQEIPHPVPWPRFPLQAKGLYFPRCLGAKNSLAWLLPWRLKMIVILTALWKPSKGKVK